MARSQRTVTRRPTPDRFDRAFTEYLTQWQDARSRDVSHDQLRYLFTNFLHNAYPQITAGEIDLERAITGLEVRGFIDLLYRRLVFEFKRDLTVERPAGREELTRYLRAQPDPDKAFGILTDGGGFEVYVLRNGELQLTDEFKLHNAEAAAARLTLDSYLFAARNVTPSAEDIVRRFGHRSAVFASVSVGLQDAYVAADESRAVQTKFSEWSNLLAHVYGSRVGNESLFLTHTYLVLLTRLLAYTALRGRTPSDADLPGAVDGTAFDRFGLTNFVEGDFFAWVLEPEAADAAISLLRGLAAHLNVYDFAGLNEDVLKELYQHLIDPAARHDLGEYYTPDWLAERTLREAGFGPTTTMLDPACGSGTFLFTGVRLMREHGLTGSDLVRRAFQNLAGIDVHPVAVMIAKVNLVLALLPDLRGRPVRGLPPISIFMADSLRVPLRPEDPVIEIPIYPPMGDLKPPRGLPGRFNVPRRLAENPTDLDDIIDRMCDLAATPGDADEDALAAAARELFSERGYARETPYLSADFKLLRWMTMNGVDSVWGFVLRNAYRPSFFAARKFDLVAGNPPWLSYRYIAAGEYQSQVKYMTIRAYGLLSARDVRLFTQMDLSTLFFAHSVEHFMKPSGTIAFVMPRSVLTGAKQHTRFQERGRDWYPLRRIIDCEGVQPLFNVPTCVIVARKGGSPTSLVPVVHLRGDLPRKNASSEQAALALAESPRTFQVLARPTAHSPYLPDVINGATIYPRNLFFVRTPPEALAFDPDRPQVETDPEIDRAAKMPWKGLRMRGEVESPFLYATMLAEDLVPFGSRRYRPVVLPIVKVLREFGSTQRVERHVINARQAAERGFTALASWLRQAERAWERHRKGTTGATLVEWLDYQSKLTRQTPAEGFKVLYNASGTHLASCAIAAAEVNEASGVHVAGFVADHKTYVFETRTELEAWYLTACLNAPSIDAAIKPYQTRGAFGSGGSGERDIHRRPFEVVAIPRFDSADERHQRLTELSRQCHRLVSGGPFPPRETVARARARVRASLHEQLAEMDSLVKEITALP